MVCIEILIVLVLCFCLGPGVLQARLHDAKIRKAYLIVLEM